MLRDIGALLHRSTRPEDIVARFGSDRWTAGDTTFGIGVSVGIASSRFLAQPALTQLLDAADRDMYKNKWLRVKQSRRKFARETPEAICP